MRHFDPLPIWYPPINEQSDTDGHTATIDFPLHALTQRPMHMYHSWGAQNPWLRQISARNWLYVHPDAAAASGLADQDWVWVVSKVGRVKAQIRLMHALNRHTVWTWNAVGKRAGTWGLQPDAPEATQGFLLNHLIPDRLPQAGDQPASGNADPITGQAAWYDLRVRLEKCAPAEAGLTAPTFAIFPALPEQTQPPATLRFGASFDRTPMPKAATPSHRERLGQPEGQGTSDRAPRHKGRP
jgi:anaerobic selenocysteine-containing dehydrogenase